MLNVNKLKSKMFERGTTVNKISLAIGINPSTFYRKMKNNSFEICEVDIIVKELELTLEEANEIFFGTVIA